MYKDNCNSPAIPDDDSDDESYSIGSCTDVQLIRNIGFIASRVRYLGQLYANFKLTNPYSAIASAASHSSSAESVQSSAAATAERVDAKLRLRILENLLVQFYEEHQEVTVIRETRGNATSKDHCFYIMNSNSTTSSSVERLLQANDDDEGDSNENTLKKNFLNVTTTAAGSSQRDAGGRGTTTMVSFAASANRGRRGSDNTAIEGRRRGSGGEAMDQLNVLSNCQQLKPIHRGSCGAAGEHLLAVNSIAKKSTVILSKSCNNVDASAGPGGNGCVVLQPLNGSGAGVGVGGGGSSAGTTAPGNNGNTEFSVVQMNNTIIQCHFSDDDFRALVKDLKRKVEYTERSNWL